MTAAEPGIDRIMDTQAELQAQRRMLGERHVTVP